MTFVEVMVTTVILTGGLMMIYRAFFLSLDYTNHLRYRLQAGIFLDNKLTEMQKYFQDNGELPTVQFEEDIKSIVFKNYDVPFRLQTHITSVPDVHRTFRVTMLLSWEERNRTINLSRSAYISKI